MKSASRSAIRKFSMLFCVLKKEPAASSHQPLTFLGSPILLIIHGSISHQTRGNGTADRNPKKTTCPESGMSAWTRCRFLAAEFSAFDCFGGHQTETKWGNWWKNHETWWKSMKLDGNPWNLMEIHGNPWLNPFRIAGEISVPSLKPAAFSEETHCGPVHQTRSRSAGCTGLCGPLADFHVARYDSIW